MSNRKRARDGAAGMVRVDMNPGARGPQYRVSARIPETDDGEWAIFGDYSTHEEAAWRADRLRLVIRYAVSRALRARKPKGGARGESGKEG